MSIGGGAILFADGTPIRHRTEVTSRRCAVPFAIFSRAALTRTKKARWRESPGAEYHCKHPRAICRHSTVSVLGDSQKSCAASLMQRVIRPNEKFFQLGRQFAPVFCHLTICISILIWHHGVGCSALRVGRQQPIPLHDFHQLVAFDFHRCAAFSRVRIAGRVSRVFDSSQSQIRMLRDSTYVKWRSAEWRASYATAPKDR
jgi:hypothetical protein